MHKTYLFIIYFFVYHLIIIIVVVIRCYVKLVKIIGLASYCRRITLERTDDLYLSNASLQGKSRCRKRSLVFAVHFAVVVMSIPSTSVFEFPSDGRRKASFVASVGL